MLIKAFKMANSGLWNGPEVTRAAPVPRGQGERLFTLQFKRWFLLLASACHVVPENCLKDNVMSRDAR